MAREAARHQTDAYAQTLHEFKGLVAELTFATKSFFFLLLGYWTDVREMLSIEAWLIAIAGIAFILASRWVILKVLRQSAVAQLLWIAPRGLITVLLFLSARETGKLDAFPFGAVMLVVLVTAALTALAHRGAAHAAAPAARAVPLAVDEFVGPRPFGRMAARGHRPIMASITPRRPRCPICSIP